MYDCRFTKVKNSKNNENNKNSENEKAESKRNIVYYRQPVCLVLILMKFCKEKIDLCLKVSQLTQKNSW